jgi:MazG family protein
MDISKLLEIMGALRNPESGCPWDLEQSFATIAPFTIEEAYEVADAIERGAMTELPDELGDLLFQVVFHAELGKERGAFDFGDVVAAICRKLIERHPHVFGSEVIDSAAEQTLAWEARKADERSAAGRRRVLDGVSAALPGLTRAVKLGRRASRVGFDWPSDAGVRAKLREELAEIDEAVAGTDREAVAAEVGDLLFAAANLCRHLDIDPEQSIRAANRRFAARFAYVEDRVNARGGWERHDLAELERYWQEAKRAG